MFYVYLTASQKNGTLYAGSCEDLRVRIEQHKAKRFIGFTAKYGVDRLVWFESHPSRHQAFRRERQIKEWRRLWKIQLIEASNPNWLDLYDDLDRLLMEDEQRGLSEFLPDPITPLIPAKAGTQQDVVEGEHEKHERHEHGRHYRRCHRSCFSCFSCFRGQLSCERGGCKSCLGPGFRRDERVFGG